MPPRLRPKASPKAKLAAQARNRRSQSFLRGHGQAHKETNNRTDRISNGDCAALVRVESTLLTPEGRSVT